MTTRTNLASVAESQIDELRSGQRARIEPSATFRVAHRFAERMEFEPVRRLLTEVLHGGEPLGAPSEVAGLHRADETRRLAAEIDLAWQTLRQDPAFEMHRLQDWFASEIDMVSRAFRHAARHGECIVQVPSARRPVKGGSKGSIALSS